MQQTLAVIVGLALVYVLWRQWRKAERKHLEQPHFLFSNVKDIFDDATIAHGEAAGTWTLTGHYEGQIFQLKAVADTLATRKLPSLWLLVTLPLPQKFAATLNLMMRPTVPTTFSNFDFLPYTLATPAGFPLHAVIRTDAKRDDFSAEILRPHLSLFETRYGKELLISPKGLRITVLVAEVDRLRYGVFREANFGDTVINAEVVKQCLATLLKLKTDLQ